MRRLVPYQTIVAAKNGDGEAMSSILHHYANYIAYYSRRKYIDALGDQHFDINGDVKQQVEAKLIYCIVCKFDHCKLPFGETLEGENASNLGHINFHPKLFTPAAP